MELKEEGSWWGHLTNLKISSWCKQAQGKIFTNVREVLMVDGEGTEDSRNLCDGEAYTGRGA